MNKQRDNITSDEDPSIPNWFYTRHMLSIYRDDARERHVDACAKEDRCECEDDSLEHVGGASERIVVAKGAT